MRYAVISKGMPFGEMVDLCKRCGGHAMQEAPRLGQVFVEFTEGQAQQLAQHPGVAVRPVGQVKHTQVPAEPGASIFAASQASLASLFYQFRDMFSPPLLGEGWTVAVLDSGIRKTHIGLAGKVVYEADFTSSPSPTDVFSHGTGVAYMLAGGDHAPGRESGLAPGMRIWNIKVLDDGGNGTAESVIMGIEHVIAKHEEAVAAGLPNEDPMYPQAMNLSLGMPDDGDPDNPIRAAVLAAFQRPIGIYAAAGNGGPDPGSILLPASMEEVWATGAITLDPFYIWPQSSRGPTREGLVKPDMVFYGVNILTASAKGDTDFEVKAGTSFSSPLLAAGGGLWMEALNRAGLQTREQKYAGIHPRALLPLLALACRKPQDAPIAMDNAYGVGQPFGDLAGRLVSGAGAGAAGAMLEPVTQIMTFGMVATLMSGFMRSLRAGA